MSNQTMEYKVVDVNEMKDKVEETGGKVGFFFDPFGAENWEIALNAFAREGWIVVTSYVQEMENSNTPFFLLGRPV